LQSEKERILANSSRQRSNVNILIQKAHKHECHFKHINTC